MEFCCQQKLPLNSTKSIDEIKVNTTRKNKKGTFCSCCNRLIYDSLPCGRKSSLDQTHKNDDNASFSSLESISSKIEPKCKCTEQVLCRSNDQYNNSKQIYSNQDVILNKVEYLCGAPSNLSLERQNTMLSNLFLYPVVII